jgi:hypothetical protein
LICGGSSECVFSGLVIAQPSGSVPIADAAAAPSPTATPAPTASPTPTIILEEALTTPDSSWRIDQHCFFAVDGLHVKNVASVNNEACLVPLENQGDIDLAVQVRQISGASTDQHGVEIRRSSTQTPSNAYLFEIDANGEWYFFKCNVNAKGSDNCNAIKSNSDPAIHTGLNAQNTLEVRAVGSHFTLLVNGTVVDQEDDASFASGAITLDDSGDAECVFKNLIITTPG